MSSAEARNATTDEPTVPWAPIVTRNPGWHGESKCVEGRGAVLVGEAQAHVVGAAGERAGELGSVRRQIQIGRIGRCFAEERVRGRVASLALRGPFSAG